MQITIKDIASRANVSTATVSRVINNSPIVKAETKKKVITAIQELNYQPDFIARSMVKKRTYSIGLIVGRLGNHFFAETAEVIIKVAERYNCHVNVYVTEEKPGKTEQYIDLLINRRVDGILIGSAFTNTSLKRLDENNIPYVLYNRKTCHENAEFVISDNFKGAFEAVNHLIRLGHQRIGIIHGPEMFETVKEKIDGYHKALAVNRLNKYSHLNQAVNFLSTKIEIPKVLNDMMDSSIKPTAIFSTSDFIALELIDYLNDKNIKVPRDVAVVGFDNILLSAHSLIELTTISTRTEEVARLAAERLMEKIEQKNKTESVPCQLKLEPKLIIRKSCGFMENSSLTNI